MRHKHARQSDQTKANGGSHRREQTPYPPQDVKYLEGVSRTCHYAVVAATGLRIPWWDDTPERDREFFRQYVEHTIRFLNEKLIRNVERAWEECHDSWVLERRKEGWSYGEQGDWETKKSPLVGKFQDLIPIYRYAAALIQLMVGLQGHLGRKYGEWEAEGKEGKEK